MNNEIVNIVDFEMLTNTFRSITNGNMITNEERRNVAVFHEMISRSSTFAHKAHKELKALNDGSQQIFKINLV